MSLDIRLSSKPVVLLADPQNQTKEDARAFVQERCLFQSVQSANTRFGIVRGGRCGTRKFI